MPVLFSTIKVARKEAFQFSESPQNDLSTLNWLRCRRRRSVLRFRRLFFVPPPPVWDQSGWNLLRTYAGSLTHFISGARALWRTE